MKKAIAFLVAILLVCAFSGPAAACEEYADATLTVAEIVNITLVDEGAPGINFGSVIAGTLAAELDQNDYPAITIRTGTENNVEVDLGIRGTITGGSIPLNDWKWAVTATGTKNALNSAYALVQMSVPAGSSRGVWHWVDVPAEATPGDHSCRIFYKSVVTGGGFS